MAAGPPPSATSPFSAAFVWLGSLLGRYFLTSRLYLIPIILSGYILSLQLFVVNVAVGQKSVCCWENLYEKKRFLL
jgi:hypothetical protein